MSRFSQRMGITPLSKAIQSESLDTETRNRLYNGLTAIYFVEPKEHKETKVVGRKVVGIPSGTYSGDMVSLVHNIWFSFFKFSRDDYSYFHHHWKDRLRKHLWNWEWHYVLDFIEFIVQNYKGETENQQFIEHCNTVFKEESVPYRFVGKEIVPLINKDEITEVEKALDSPFIPIHEHFEKALEHLSDRVNPDYPNSIKESISAVEAVCQIIVGQRGVVLNRALGRLVEAGVQINEELKKGFRQLYSWTSSGDGIRHAMMDLPSVDQDDARYMLVTCSAFVNYLIAEAGKAGINLQTNYETIRES